MRASIDFLISNLIGQAISISKQLHGWIGSLKDSDIKGVRFLDRRAKQRVEKERELAEFDLEMKKYRDDLHARLVQRDKDAARGDG